MCLMIETRPDLAYAVRKPAQFCESSTSTDWNAAERMLRYIDGTRDLNFLSQDLTSLE